MNVAPPPSTSATLNLTPWADSNVDCTSRCVMDGLIRTAADRCEATVAPLPWRSVGSVTMKTGHLTRVDNNTHDGIESIHGWCAMLFSFSWLDIDGCPRACCDHKSCRVCAQSARVSHPVIRVVPRVLRSPDHTTTNALNSGSAGNVLNNNPEDDLEQHFRAIDFST